VPRCYWYGTGLKKAIANKANTSFQSPRLTRQSAAGNATTSSGTSTTHSGIDISVQEVKPLVPLTARRKILTVVAAVSWVIANWNPCCLQRDPTWTRHDSVDWLHETKIWPWQSSPDRFPCWKAASPKRTDLRRAHVTRTCWGVTTKLWGYQLYPYTRKHLLVIPNC
jgi:hypothetical protein